MLTPRAISNLVHFHDAERVEQKNSPITISVMAPLLECPAPDQDRPGNSSSGSPAFLRRAVLCASKAM